MYVTGIIPMKKREKRSRGLGDKARDMSDATILVVDDNPESLVRTVDALQNEGWQSEKMCSAAEAETRLNEKAFDVIILDAKPSEMESLRFLELAKTLHPETEVLFLTDDGSADSAARAMSLGAFDCLRKPLDNKSLTSSVHSALRKRAFATGALAAGELVEKEYSFENIVGRCERMREIFRLIRKVAPATAPVIIQGESGTGKELVARAIHNNSGRANHKFLAINSASLPESLLESELFGYRKGAFTGALTDRIGPGNTLSGRNRGHVRTPSGEAAAGYAGGRDCPGGKPRENQNTRESSGGFQQGPGGNG